MPKSEFTNKWIIETGIPIAESYNGNITLRALHYRLVAAGMTNDTAHYKKVVNAMIQARWEGLVGFNSFLDHERQTLGLNCKTKLINCKAISGNRKEQLINLNEKTEVFSLIWMTRITKLVPWKSKKTILKVRLTN